MHGRHDGFAGDTQLNDSSDISGVFEYLDQRTLPGSSLSFASMSSHSPPASGPASPMGRQSGPSPVVPRGRRWMSLPLPSSRERQPEEGAAARAWRLARKGITNFMENLLEPRGTEQTSANEGRNEPILEVVRMSEPFAQGGNIVGQRAAISEGFYFPPAEEEYDDSYSEEPIVEIDLVSALRAYRKNPNECFGHLVAASLSGRTANNLVTADELKEARLNPYLVCMLLESERLNVSDSEVQREVQRCVDALITTEVERVPRAIFERLVSLFKPPFVRLSDEQHKIVKDSGFEFVQLLYEYPHLSAGGSLCWRSNDTVCSLQFNLFVMVLNTMAEMLCQAGFGLVLMHWMGATTLESHGNYGLYTAIMYGVGYASHLIAMIFLMRGRERQCVYGKMDYAFPSPHLLVLPVVPLYNVVSIVTFVRYSLANRGGMYVAIIHDIKTAQTLSSMSFVTCVAVPQFMCQMFLTSTGNTTSEFNKHFSYSLLSSGVVVTYFMALLRLLWTFTTKTSINYFGFACYSFQSSCFMQRNSALLHMVYSSLPFVLQLNILALVTELTNIGECEGSIVKIVLSGISIVTYLAVFVLLVLRREIVFRIAWVLIPLVALQG
ncbi:unnamed protein product, partial [Trypanosoma congolense IL3000]